MKIIADSNIPFVVECFSSIGDVEIVSGREMTADTVRDADVLLVRSVTKVNSDLLSGSNVKFIATATIGIEHVDSEVQSTFGRGCKHYLPINGGGKFVPILRIGYACAMKADMPGNAIV